MIVQKIKLYNRKMKFDFIEGGHPSYLGELANISELTQFYYRAVCFSEFGRLLGNGMIKINFITGINLLLILKRLYKRSVILDF